MRQFDYEAAGSFGAFTVGDRFLRRPLRQHAGPPLSLVRAALERDSGREGENQPPESQTARTRSEGTCSTTSRGGTVTRITRGGEPEEWFVKTFVDSLPGPSATGTSGNLFHRP